MTTGLITPVTEGQKRQFGRLLDDALVRAGREMALSTKEAMRALLANGGQFQTDFVLAIIRNSVADTRFSPVRWFKFTVPKKYKHSDQLARFAEVIGTSCYHASITDTNYARTTELIPGKTYVGKIFDIKGQVSPEACLRFLATQRAILVGAQGLSLAYQLKKAEFPTGKWIVSLDQKEALWKNSDNYHCLTRLGRHSGGEEAFFMLYFEKDILDHHHCLFCVSEA